MKKDEEEGRRRRKKQQQQQEKDEKKNKNMKKRRKTRKDSLRRRNPLHKRLSPLWWWCCEPARVEIKLVHSYISTVPNSFQKVRTYVRYAYFIKRILTRYAYESSYSWTQQLSRRTTVRSTLVMTTYQKCFAKLLVSDIQVHCKTCLVDAACSCQSFTPCSKKGDTKLMAVTLLILNQFANFFECQIFQKICSKVYIKDPTAPYMCRYTILWNINVRKWATVAN